MIWSLLAGLLAVSAFAISYRFRERFSPGIVLLVALPITALLMLANQSGGSGVEAATAEETFDLSGKLFGIDGKPVDVTEYEGKIIFMNFWATWCGPCRAEMPSMAKLYEELKEQGLVMVAITDESPEPVRKYLEKSPYPFPILLDPEAILFRRLRVRGLPTTFVFNDKNELVLEHVGGYNWSTPDLVAEFRRMLNEAE